MCQGSSNDGWLGLAQWWLDEVEGDPAYEQVVTPLMLDLLAARPDQLILDLGCGDGRVMRELDKRAVRTVGVDQDLALLVKARVQGPVFRAKLPWLAPIHDRVFDGAYMCLVLEHLEDHRALFSETARVVKPGGLFALVVNHPIFTAPDSAPIHDSDGEPLWRPGEYFSAGWTDEPADGGFVRFHHRTMAELLTSAARAGWVLDEMVEVGVTDDQVLRTPWLRDQRHIPRLLGCRWLNGSGP